VFGFGCGSFRALALACRSIKEATTHTACTVASSFNASSLCTPLGSIGNGSGSRGSRGGGGPMVVAAGWVGSAVVAELRLNANAP